MDSTLNYIHEKAVAASKNYKRSEAELLDAISGVMKAKVHLSLGYGNLFDYVTKELKLPEGIAYHYIGVARKSVQIPEIKQAVESGQITVSQAKRILPVITKETQKEWIEKSAELTQRELEKEVVKVNPKALTRATLIPITEEFSKLSVLLSGRAQVKLKKAQSILSQKKQSSLKYEEVLEALLDSFLKIEEKPKKLASRQKKAPKTVTPRLKKETLDAYDHQCAFTNPDGTRCSNTYFLDAHHKVNKIDGGLNEQANLVPLCSNHHKFIHLLNLDLTNLARARGAFPSGV